MRKFVEMLCVIFIISIMISGCSSPDYQLSTSVVPNGGGSISPSNGTFKGGNYVVLVADPAQYYNFVGWGGDASGSTNPLKLKMSSNKQVVAQFSKITPNIETISVPQDGGTVRPSSGQYEAGTTITFIATPNNGYRFVKWGTDASGTNSSVSILVNKNMTVTANFIRQYKLAISADPNSGTVNLDPNLGIYDAGTSVKLTATPVFPWAFKNWVGADNNINPTSVVMNADKSVSVNFVKLIKKTQTPIQKSGGTYGIATVSIGLNQSEWVEGTIDCDTALPPQAVYIQSPDGQKVNDFGRPGHAAFQFQASVTGEYDIVVQANYISTWGTGYNVAYTVYGLQ